MSIYAPSLIGERAYRPFAFSGGLGVVSPAAQRIFQRTDRTGGALGYGQATVPLTLTPAQPVALLEYQLRDAASPANVLKPWSQVTPAPLAAGVTTTVSATVPARAGWTLLDLRANTDSSSVVTTRPFGVGEVAAATGQSLASDFWGTTESGDTTTLASLGCLPSPFSACLAGWDGGANGAAGLPSAGQAWSQPSDIGPYRSAFAAELTRLLVAATGVNAGLVGYGWTGQPIAQWAPTGNPGNPNIWANLVSVLDQSPVFATLLWCQGHNDARTPATGINGSITPAATYVAALQTILSTLATRYRAVPFTRILTSIPSIGPAAAAKYPIIAIETIRAAQQAVVAADNMALQVDALDVALAPDQIHPSQAGNITFARHIYRAMMATIAPKTFSAGDLGPIFLGAGTRAAGSACISLPITQFGGSSLRCPGGAPATQFQVFPSGTLTGALPIAAADINSPDQIALTLATTPPDSQALDVWYRIPYDSATIIANGIYDDAVDLDELMVGRQLSIAGAATALPVPAPAATATITLAQPSGSFVAGQGSVALSGATTSDTGAITVAIDGGVATILVSKQSGAFAGTIPVPMTGGTHVITVALADAPSRTASVTITVVQATLSGVPSSGIQGVILVGAGYALSGVSTAYAALRVAGADEGARVVVSGGLVPPFVPQSAGSYALALYDAPVSGNPLALSGPIAVSAALALPAIGGTLARFDASAAATVFADADRTTPQLTSFGPVQGWADQSGNANHVQQQTLTRAPALVLGRRASRPGLKLIGASGQMLQNLVGASWMRAQMSGSLTVLAVFEISSDASSNAPYVPLSLAYSGNPAGNNCFDVQASTNTAPWVGAARNPPSSFGSAKDTSAPVVQKSTLLKVAGSFNAEASTMTVVVNADAPVTKTGIATPLIQPGTEWDTFLIGGQPGTPPFGFDGYIYEIDLWPVAATTEQLQSLVSYATTKWGS